MNARDIDLEVERVAQALVRDIASERRLLPEMPVMECPGQDVLNGVLAREVCEDGRPLDEVVDELTRLLATTGSRTHHPRFFGFIPGPASTLSWLGDVLTGWHNQHAATWTHAPGAIGIEQRLLQWFATHAGYGPEAGGQFVSGGSIANLTALVAARDTHIPDDELPQATAYISDEAHSSVTKSLRAIGVPAARIRQIPIDHERRMRVTDLRASIEHDRQSGLRPFVVIATAGATNTGAIDPLADIADVCDQNNLWMHVDGAFGASVLLSDRHRHLLAGIERSDSLSWDAHKWLFQTYGVGMLLVRNWRTLAASFHNDAAYLRDVEADDATPNPADLGLELTRPARGVKLWLTLQALGKRTVTEKIDHGLDTAERFATMISALSDWEVITGPRLAILNVRFAPQGFTDEALDALNAEISRQLIEDGRAAVFTTRVDGRTVLRIATIHPDTSESDITETVCRMNSLARNLRDSNPRRPIAIGGESSASTPTCATCEIEGGDDAGLAWSSAESSSVLK